MTDDTTNTPAVDAPRTELRFLTPDTCHIHLGSHDALHVTITNDRIYGGVYAAYVFPVAYPEGYISLMHSIGDGKGAEIGIIRDLAEFPEADAELIRRALQRRYFVHVIANIVSIGIRYGYLAMSVETDKGPAAFMMRWQHDCAIDYGRKGKVLIDLDENRYLVPDLDALPPRQQREFRRYIYW